MLYNCKFLWRSVQQCFGKSKWEKQVCLSCKITPDASAVSKSGEEGGKNPKSVDQLCNFILKNIAEPIYMKIGSDIA